MKIIVTGSEGLLGKEIVRHLEKKYDVIKLDKILGHDLTDELFVKKWFKKNHASSLVNCFALNDHVEEGKKRPTLFDITLKSFSEFLDTNLVSLFSVCREFARNNKSGSIINFSATTGIVSARPDLYNGGHKHVAIYVIDASGNNLRQITKGVELVSITSPNWSPDGRQVVFVSWVINKGKKAKSSGIFTIDTNGKNIREVTKKAKLQSVKTPRWSPDGKQIVFSAVRGDKKGDEIYIVDINGNNLQQLTESGWDNNDPTWSPNGREIIFSSNRSGNYEIYIMDNHGKNIRNLTNHPAPDYQPAYFVASLLSVKQVKKSKATSWAKIK